MPMLHRCGVLLFASTAVALLGAASVASATYDANLDGCFTVKQGHHYPNKSSLIAFNGLNEWSVNASLADSCASYACTCSDGCQQDWNKLWGKTRCGYLTHVHKHSDRFVWRRYQDSNKVEVAAYAYDDGRKPYQNPDLLKVFAHQLDTNTYYTLKMIHEIDKTTYQLISDGVLLESQVIIHDTQCSDFNEGYLLGLYYGGDCEAPQDVSICYQS